MLHRASVAKWCRGFSAQARQKSGGGLALLHFAHRDQDFQSPGTGFCNLNSRAETSFLPCLGFLSFADASWPPRLRLRGLPFSATEDACQWWLGAVAARHPSAIRGGHLLLSAGLPACRGQQRLYATEVCAGFVFHWLQGWRWQAGGDPQARFGVLKLEGFRTGVDLVRLRRSTDNLPTGHAFAYFKDWEDPRSTTMMSLDRPNEFSGGMPRTAREAEGISGPGAEFTWMLESEHLFVLE